MDTTTVDWWPSENQMIAWLAEDAAANRLEERGKPELLQVVGNAVELVRPGGYLIFDHWISLSYRDQEWFPWELFYHMVPMTREWLAESGLPLSEVAVPDCDPQWWMVLRVEG